jgi:hypothetical protein
MRSLTPLRFTASTRTRCVAPVSFFLIPLAQDPIPAPSFPAPLPFFPHSATRFPVHPQLFLRAPPFVSPLHDASSAPVSLSERP